MPLANYITEFLSLDRKAQATAVIKGNYTVSQLESLQRHATSPTVLDTIKTMMGHGEFDLEQAVTPTPIERQNGTVVPFSLDLQSLAAHMNYRYEILTNPSRSQSRALVELGFMVLLAKQELPHGQLTEWVKNNTNVTERWARFARRAAEQFIDQHGEQALLLLCNPSAEADQTDRVLAEQLMMDFTGGKGPSALLDHLGIKKRPKAKTVELPPGETVEHLDAANTWTQIAESISVFGLKEENWAELTAAEREGLYDIVHELDNRLKASLKGGQHCGLPRPAGHQTKTNQITGTPRP